jgi:pyruvate formate lyase activating enzyme
MEKTRTAPSVPIDANTREGTPLRVLKIQRTCVHDGPGLRTTVFFKGCPLACLWCQNPEAIAIDTNDVESAVAVERVLEEVLRDKAYYSSTGGGITISGGEPLLQDADSLYAFLKALKQESIHVSAETTLHVPWNRIQRFLPLIDLFLVDLKVVGDDALHQALTGQSDALIQENVRYLTDTGAKVRFRMLMVPGHNDDDQHIKNAADFLRGLNHSSVELLRYHNMYEEKAKRLGLTVPQLNITPAQSLRSLKNGIALFAKYGISAHNQDLEEPPKKAGFTQRVQDIQQDIRDSGRALCIEVSKLKTKYYKKNGFNKPTPIHRAERLAYVLNNKTVKVFSKELLVGNFTSKRVAGQVWEEHYGIMDISFLYKINRQKPVSFQCSRRERWYFYAHIFPLWLKHSLIRKVNPTLSAFMVTLARSSEMIAGFNNNMAAIAHFIVNFERMLTLGTPGLLGKLKRQNSNTRRITRTFMTAPSSRLKVLRILPRAMPRVCLQ